MSNINSVTSPYEQRAYIGETTEKRGSKLEKTPTEMPEVAAAKDRVSLSTESRDMQAIKSAVLAGPDEANDPAQSASRSEKLMGLQKAVESGQYKVNAEEVAEKMIGSIVDRFI